MYHSLADGSSVGFNPIVLCDALVAEERAVAGDFKGSNVTGRMVSGMKTQLLMRHMIRLWLI